MVLKKEKVYTLSLFIMNTMSTSNQDADDAWRSFTVYISWLCMCSMFILSHLCACHRFFCWILVSLITWDGSSCVQKILRTHCILRQSAEQVNGVGASAMLTTTTTTGSGSHGVAVVLVFHASNCEQILTEVLDISRCCEPATIYFFWCYKVETTALTKAYRDLWKPLHLC